ncbi:MAG: AAA family ATPase [Chloroflexota bacterium]
MHLNQVSLHPERYPTRECYPFNLAIFQRSEQIPLPTPVTIFVGENGSGKSTLLEAIARKCGIHIWDDGDMRRFENNPHEDRFYTCLSVGWQAGPVPGSFFGSRNFRYFTRAVDEWAASDPSQLAYFGGKSLVTQSHGQSLMAYFRNRYGRRGLYLLDEPETALSPRSLFSLRDLLAEMSQAGHAQFILATHSPILLSCPGATLYSFDGESICPVCVEDTEHDRLYREFFTPGAQVPSPETCTHLQMVRDAIDGIDRQVIDLIGRRAAYVQAAARFKIDSAAVQAEERVYAMLARRRTWATEAGLDPDVIEKLYRDLVQYFIGEEMARWKRNTLLD